MLSARSIIRCSFAYNKILPKTPQLVKINSKCTYTKVSAFGNILPKQLGKSVDLKYNCLVQSRSFASKSDSDVNAEDLERIYYGTLTTRMRAVKVFSLTTSCAGLAAQPILMEQGMKIGGAGMAVFLCSIAGFFTFITPILLHFVTKKYVTEMHYNPSTKEYVATTVNLFLQKVQTKFYPSDVKVPEVPGMFTSFNVGGRSLFVDPTLFEDPEHYVRIMGYDKPIDFKLDLKATAPTNNDLNKTKK